MLDQINQTQPIEAVDLPKIVFNCSKSIYDKLSFVCTREWFDSVLDDPLTLQNCTIFQMGNDEAKKQLPVIYPHATFTGDGRRKDENAIESGLVMLDVDDHDGSKHFDPRRFFEEKISQRLATDFKHVLLVYITPSGRGIRVIAKRQSKRDIHAEQIYLYHTVCAGLPDDMLDTQTANPSRACYLAPREYMLHIDYDELFGGSVDPAFCAETETLAIAKSAELTVVQSDEQSSELTDEQQTEATDVGESAEKADADGLPILPEVRDRISKDGVLYGDIAYEDIKTELLVAIKATGKKSTRNNKTYELASYLRHICRSENHVLSLMPNWGLSAKEVSETVHSACSAMLPNMPVPQLLKSIIDRLSDADAPADIAPALPLASDLPKAINTILAPYPQQRKAALAISALAPLGTLATRVRCLYDNTEIHSLSFMTCLVAPPSSYKGSMPKLYNRLMRPIIQADEVTRDRMRDWRDEQVAIGDSAKKEKNPHFEIRDLVPRTTYAALVEYVGNSNKKHLSICAPEIDFLAQQKDSWAKEGSVFRNAFDNERIGQDAKSNNAANGYYNLYLNACISGTPKAVLNFFRSPENGLVSRILFCIYPDASGQKKNPDQKRTPKNERELDEIIDRLMHEGEDGCYDENPLEIKKLQQEIDNWLEAKRELYNMTQNHAIDDFRKRSGVIGFRAGVLAYILEGHKFTKKALNFALWVAEYVLWAQVKLFGVQMNECSSANRDILYKKSANSNEIAFLQLPEVFTTGDVTRVYISQGLKGSGSRKIAGRWLEEGWVEKTDTYTYHKTEKGKVIAARLKAFNETTSSFAAQIDVA